MSNYKDKWVKESMEDYHKNPAIGASKINLMLKSPAHYKWYCLDGNEKKETPALWFGKIAHLAMLETEEFNLRFVLEAKFAGTGSRKAYADWEASLPTGTIILSDSEYETLRWMSINLKNEKQYPDVVQFMKKPGVREHSFYFTDPVTGLQCKFRPDFLTEDGWIMDLKTTTCSRTQDFERNLRTYGYHVSAAFYCYGFEQVFGYKPRGYVFVPIEKTAPYIPAVLTASEATVITAGEIDFRKGLNLIKECTEKNYWPGYQRGVENVSIPDYQLRDYEDEVLP